MKKNNIVEGVVGAPAKALDKSIEASSKAVKNITENGPVKTAKEYWHTLGPGLTTGASDDDPSGIVTYSQAGAQYGFNFLWLSAFTFPLMSIVQEMCARIGLVTGRGLASNIRINFPRWVLYLCTFLLFLANTFNIGANLGAMAESIRLFNPNLSFTLLVFVIAGFILALQIFSTYEKYARYLKWLALVLFSYIFATLMIDGLDWGSILKSAVLPKLEYSKDQFILICAILGTTISPYLFFWQTSQEIEEAVLRGKTNVKLRQDNLDKNEIKDMRIDVWSGMLLSNLVMFFIITSCAATLNMNGITNINSAAEAAQALRPFAGDASYFLFTVGIIGTGLLGIPVLAGSSSYALAETFGWRQGLHYKLRQAYSFYGIMIISMVLGLILNFVGLDPMKALIYSAVANGLAAPLILVVIVLISSNKKIMGSHANGPFVKSIGWITTSLMIVAGIATIISLF